MGDIRFPYNDELRWFMQNYNTPAMVAKDNQITFNPHSDRVTDSVMRNEQARLAMRRTQPPLADTITPQQESSFQGTPYEGDRRNMLQTILARMLTRDPSGGSPTPQQSGQVDYLRKLVGAVE